MSKDKRTGWLADLKEGDKVIVRSGSPLYWESRTGRRVRTVTKVTPTGRINVGNSTFDHCGRLYSQAWHTDRLEEYTEERLKTIKAGHAQRFLQCCRWEKLSDDQLIELETLVTPYFPMTHEDVGGF